MKKFFGLFLIAGMLVISACGTGNKEEGTTTDSTAVEQMEPVADTTATVVEDTTAAPVQ
jgi:hypothetical protein